MNTWKVVERALISPIFRLNNKDETLFIPLGGIEGNKTTEKLLKKYGALSPSDIRTVEVDCVGVTREGFLTPKIRFNYSREDNRSIKDEIYEVSQKIRKPQKGILSAVIKYEMYNIEELTLGKDICVLLGLKLDSINMMGSERATQVIDTSKTSEKLFGVDKKLTVVLPRLRTLRLGNCELNIETVNNNWVQGRNEKWHVRDDLYKKDLELYDFVRRNLQ